MTYIDAHDVRLGAESVVTRVIYIPAYFLYFSFCFPANPSFRIQLLLLLILLNLISGIQFP